MKGERKIAWGLSLHLDLYNCNPDKVRDPKLIRKFIRELCDLIEMKRYKSTLIYKFGEGKIEGYSLVQMIETSSIVIHFEEQFGSQVMMDLFTCKKFNIKQAVNFTKNFFEGIINNKWSHQRGHR